ncbi:MAG: dihydroxyacetone kinase subunit DhaL [Planctomycetota bacterium]
MPDHVDYETMTAMLSAVVERIRDARDTLATLDAATGDGDHGAAMGKVADAIAQCIDDGADRELPALLSKIGWAVMGVDAGSTGPLYGSLFLGMSEGCANAERLDTTGLAAAMEHGVARLRTYSKAGPGDKTLLDALLPAVEAVRATANEGGSVADALDAAAIAAEQGAERTTEMQAAFGRAKNIGERSIGHVDPGAASMSVVFAGLKKGVPHG